MDLLSFTIPGIPPSYDKHFKINYSFKEIYLTREAQKFKQTVMMAVPPFPVNPDDRFEVEIIVHTDWYYKNGKLRRLDIHNMDKLLVDAVFYRLGIDDSHVWKLTSSKYQDCDNSFTQVNIARIPHEC